MPLTCRNFDCDNKMSSTYYSVTRIKMPGNKRKRTTFCSIKCLAHYVNIWKDQEERKRKEKLKELLV